MKLVRNTILLLFFVILSIPVFAQHELYGIWAKRAAFGSNGNADIRSSTVDEAGNVYLSGVFTGTLNFSDNICNPAISGIPSSLGKGLFVMKFDKDGKYQWHTVYEINVGTPDMTTSSNYEALIYDYKGGKLLLYGRMVYQGIMTTMGIKATLNSQGTSTSDSFTKPTNDGSGANDRYFFQFLHVIDANTGGFVSLLSPFISGTQNVTAEFQGDEVHTIHMGFGGSIYPTSESVVSVYNANTGVQIGTDKKYPGQPFSDPGKSGCGSTIVKHITMPGSGEQVMIHNSYNKTAPNVDIPSYYLLVYNNTYDTKLKQILLSDRSIQYFPQITTDDSDHLYIATNYGESKHWDTGADFPNSNKLTNFLNSGRNFETNNQRNSVVLAKMKQDFSGTEWIHELGDNNKDFLINANDMKTVGNYTYLVGHFMGKSVNFGGIALSNSGDNGNWNFDGYYAVFDNSNGNCLYAINIGEVGYEQAQTLSLSADGKQVLIGGIYTSTIFQSDPSDRLYPLSSSGSSSQGFVTLYSTNPYSQPTPYPSSFGDAPESYGVAVHHAYQCLTLGGLNLSQLQSAPEHSLMADTDPNDDAVIIANDANGYVDLVNGLFGMNASGTAHAYQSNRYNGTSDTAKVIGWIDYNRNGVFDGAEEASVVHKAIPGGGGTGFALEWPNAHQKLRNGVTYMRLRITTDAMDETQPTGLFFNGEVEDYRLNFKLIDFQKTAETARTPSNTGEVGDTITYTLKISNTTRATISNIVVFDPIPEYTTYVAGSANSLGAPATITLHGQPVDVIQWPALNLAGGTDTTYRFKVVISGSPLTDTIPNIAYLSFNNDTISSAGESCNLAEIIVNPLSANNDYLAVFRNDSILSAWISANDSDPNRNFVRDTILSVERGTATLNEPRDGTLKYITEANYLGLDSIDYRIKTNNDSADARVYVAVIDTEAQKYVGCPGADVTVKLVPNNNSRITYEWYSSFTGSTIISNRDTVKVTMANHDTTVYVQVKIDGNNATPRLPVTIWLSDNCGVDNPTDCAVEGTLLFKEDFGGNSVLLPDMSATALPAGVTSYTFTQSYHPSDGQYSINKGLENLASTWVRIPDHTHDTTFREGYLMLVNASHAPQVFYSDTIKGLCSNMELYFSTWVANLVRTSSPTFLDPKLRFVLEDAITGDILAVFNTGQIPKESDGDGKWKHYGFKFTTSTSTSICFKIYNDEKGGNGNDLVLDDIEVRLCVPEVTIHNPIANDTAICAGNAITFEGTYTDDGSYGNDLVYHWEYSQTGNVNIASDWSEIVGSSGSSSTGVVSPNSTYTISSVQPVNEGYYRLVVANSTTINQPNCRAASRIIRLRIHDSPKAYSDIRVQTCTNIGNINLTSYVDTTDLKTINWTRVNTTAPAIGASTGIVNTNSLVHPQVHIYKYEIKNSCYTRDAKLFLKTAGTSLSGSTPDTVVVCYLNANNIQLNRIMGIGSKGVWSYDPVGTASYVTENATGGLLLDGEKAYAAGTLPLYPYNGDALARKAVVKFKVTDPASCLFNHEYTLVIILTSRVIQ